MRQGSISVVHAHAKNQTVRHHYVGEHNHNSIISHYPEETHYSRVLQVPKVESSETCSSHRTSFSHDCDTVASSSEMTSLDLDSRNPRGTTRNSKLQDESAPGISHMTSTSLAHRVEKLARLEVEADWLALTVKRVDSSLDNDDEATCAELGDPFQSER
eukprot:TRINITY_DN1352_c0_g1_i6.p1 TRINITY_DN1352_c0_g1~~TRINITY_DN1352_c0_g1_i6.p1  ORF type:complete len:159 (-),score=10.58 TRINITY_DN1352_c0_g1_i6:93-569(-)